MTKMKAMRFYRSMNAEQEPLVLEEVDVPEPGVGQLRMKINLCGVCHTDLHIVEGDINPPKTPVTPGHQVVGEVEKLGEGVKNFEIGDRVGVPWLYRADGTCAFCQIGRENLCRDAQFTGFHHDGGFAEYMLADARYTLPLPDKLEDDNAAPMLCAGIIGYRSLNQGDVHPGERVGLVGFGASAHLAIQVAQFWDCEVYIFTRSQEHRMHAKELGAAWVGGAEDDVPTHLDRVVIFAPAGHLVPTMLKKMRRGGTLTINAIHMSPIPEMEYGLIYGERTIRSVMNATYQDGVEFLALAAEIPVETTVNFYELEDANKALVDIKQSNINGAAVLRIG